jgi:Tol biopolymer transport system component
MIASCLLVAVTLLVAAPATAQYFGRNNVQYENFDFKVLKTPHFDIYYYPEEAEAVQQAALMAERWYARLSKMLGYEFRDRQPLILYASHPHFEQTNTVGGPPGESTGGVTELFKRRIVLPFAGPLAETDHVLGHELVHGFQFAITGQGGVLTDASVPNAVRLPLWFIEGMAEYLSVGPVDPHTAMWMRDAARQEKLPTIKDLSNPRYFPYRYGQALWAYIAGRWGDDAVAEILKAASSRGATAEGSIEEILGIDTDALSKDWHEAIRDAYRPHEARKPASAYGRALITDKAEGGELNIAPALSPDGKELIFLSERSLFSIELYRADVSTGRVEQTLSKTAVDPHYESLQFINSSGAFDPSGRRIALGAVAKGEPVLAIMDAQSGRREQEVPFSDLGEIFSPTWSPDGRQVAFSAVVGGLTDLFIYDLEAKKLRRVTNDAYADLQPAWSPDGKSIAFVSDRFSTNLETLSVGNYRLAVADPATGTTRALGGFEDAKNINPQWSSDGRSVYFLSDRGGITNLYRLVVDGGELLQVTDLVTGVSGITALSPALASASKANRVVFSSYENGDYNIYAVESADVLAGHPPLALPTATAALLPGGRERGEVVALTNNAAFGLPQAREFEVEPYKPKLTLDYIAQPSVAIGVDRYGTYAGGGTALFFSDMLGHHTVGGTIQLNGRFEDFGGQIGYINRKNRLNWGASIQQIPYVTGSFSNGVTTIDGERAYVEETTLFRQTERSVTGLAAYPISRAQRLELNVGWRNVGFSRKQFTQAASLETGRLLIDEERDLGGPESVNLGEVAGALVYDSSLFGATSPILGRRFRLEAAPTFGSIRYTGVLADLRQYVMPVRPYTLAFRALHYGRYGSGGEDPRFTPLFIGYGNLVRGYDVDSFSASECVGGAAGDCPVFDQLIGSRILVANAELRFPLLGIFGAKNLYGPIPIELGVFADAGVAWTAADEPKIFGGNRELVKSVGATARVNLFGYVIVQIDYARPLDRPGKGWVWQFNFVPGF